MINLWLNHDFGLKGSNLPFYGCLIMYRGLRGFFFFWWGSHGILELVQICHIGRQVSSSFDISMAPDKVQHFLFLSSSDRTVKIWRARGGLDSTLEATDNADEVASNWKEATDWVMNPPMMLLPCTLTANCTARLTQHPELPKHTVSAQNIQSRIQKTKTSVVIWVPLAPPQISLTRC